MVEEKRVLPRGKEKVKDEVLGQIESKPRGGLTSAKEKGKKVCWSSPRSDLYR